MNDDFKSYIINMLINSRPFTKEEAKEYDRALDKLFKPTGRSFWDFYDEDKKNEDNVE